VRNYTFGDLITRHRTMHGYAVLSPMGFDSFGLPAENAALRTGTHPRTFTDARIDELKASIRRLGSQYDWRREVRSHDPQYIHWTQWIFLRLLEAGLAYRKKAPVNWCPGCQTVLANEQVLADGTCERSGDVVVKRDLEQWFFRITAYADELLAALDDLEWPERVKAMQRNWIGRSEGAEFDLTVEGRPDLTIRVFTTRPDTSFGMTFVVLSTVLRWRRSSGRSAPAPTSSANRPRRRSTSAACSPGPTPSTRSPARRSGSTSLTTC
jgi:leucyl-tRNA synthetase